MRCRTAERYISQKLDDELMPKHAASLAQHLARCSSCKAFLEDTRRLQSRLQDAPLPQYPSWMHQRIMHNLPQAKTRFWNIKPAYSFASAGLAIAFSLYIGALTGIRGYQESGYFSQNAGEQSIQLSFGENSLMEMYDE